MGNGMANGYKPITFPGFDKTAAEVENCLALGKDRRARSENIVGFRWYFVSVCVCRSLGVIVDVIVSVNVCVVIVIIVMMMKMTQTGVLYGLYPTNPQQKSRAGWR